LLCLGLYNAAKADAFSAAANMNTDQSEREGGQDGLKDDQDMLKGRSITKSEKEDGQTGVKADQDKLKGLKSSHTIKGEVLSVEGNTYYRQEPDGTAVHLHPDHTTREIGNLYRGTRVEPEVNDRGHALSICSTESTDRQNEADRPS
jgi:hypothetical protein